MLQPVCRLDREEKYRGFRLTCKLEKSKLVNMNIKDLKSHSLDVTSLMKMLANSHRLMILCELHKGESSVGMLQQAVGLGQSALSQHLAKLRHNRLVAVRRDAQTIYYSLADPKVREVMALLYRLYCDPLSNDITLKETIDDD